MHTETQLWIWFLFGSGLSAQRAKQLLYQWQHKDLSLQAALAAVPTQAKAMGLAPQEAAKLTPPNTLPHQKALRWDEPPYPRGLQELPLKMRPALIFYCGAAHLLMRPIIHMTENDIPETSQDAMHQIVEILLGGTLLPAAIRGSAQATLLLEEMQNGEGEILLFARAGIAQLKLSEQEQQLLEAQRLVIVTPLPPQTRANPAWAAILESVAHAAASGSISNEIKPQTVSDEVSPAPNLLFSETPPQLPLAPHITHIDIPEDIFNWLADIPTDANPAATLPITPVPQTEKAPLTPEETLNIIEVGGKIPEALRKKLLELNRD